MHEKDSVSGWITGGKCGKGKQTTTVFSYVVLVLSPSVGLITIERCSCSEWLWINVCLGAKWCVVNSEVFCCDGCYCFVGDKTLLAGDYGLGRGPTAASISDWQLTLEKWRNDRRSCLSVVKQRQLVSRGRPLLSGCRPLLTFDCIVSKNTCPITEYYRPTIWMLDAWYFLLYHSNEMKSSDWENTVR